MKQCFGKKSKDKQVLRSKDINRGRPDPQKEFTFCSAVVCMVYTGGCAEEYFINKEN